MKVFLAKRIITLNDEIPYIENGAIAVSDGSTVKVGKDYEVCKEFPEAEKINLGEKLVIPGFLNTHMHLYSTFARGFGFGNASPSSFRQILESIWWKLDSCLSEEDELYYSAIVPIIEGLKSGTTGIIDHHASFGLIDGSLDVIEKAVLDTGIRAVLAFETSDRWGEEKKKASIKENIRYIKKNKGSSLNALFGLHASMTLSDKTLEESVSMSNNLDTGFHIHVAEGPEDVEDSLSKYNMRVVERLSKFGILGSKSICVHCIHINEHEIELLASSQSNVIHNPESNMNNAVGVAPVAEMAHKGVTLGLGTDGYTPSMIESVKVAYILPKLHYKNPQAGSMLAKTMLFENNRKIFSKYFPKEMGIIKEGAYADFVTLNYVPPTPLNESNFFFHLIFGIRDNAISDVIIGGEFVVKEGSLAKIDEKEIMYKSLQVAKKFQEKLS